MGGTFEITLLPKLYAKQREAIYSPARYSVIYASTKCGKTAGCLVWIIDQACRERGNYWWVAPVFSQTKIAFGRLRRALSAYASYIRVNDSELRIDLPNGSSIWFKSADHPDSLYGEDVKAAVIDEGSRVKEDAWFAVRSTLTFTKGPVRVIGNMTVRSCWMYRLWLRGKQGDDPSVASYLLTAYDAVEAGVLDPREIEDAKRSYPENVFRALYLCEPDDDSGNPFGASATRSCVAPLSGGPPVVWGVDLAKSADWTVAIALDKDGRVCRFERWQGSWEETTERLTIILGTTPTLVDSTGVGDPILERLQAACPRVEGFKFNQSSKQSLMLGLAAAIHERSVSYPDGRIEEELLSFEYHYVPTGVRYEAPQGLHDDCVCALALAVHKLRHRPTPIALL